ncbi:hypothetical protein [Helicobacter trogontum]|uniref:hypothetical protein n=1 Tax=Helicobacter trogontum TaxID=50960 RepID=UPI002A91FD31|nr:hypothetical protein [Helicobacter trogontum]MDY5186262.1 hypothetical protein [Helicobacter trogontum]
MQRIFITTFWCYVVSMLIYQNLAAKSKISIKIEGTCITLQDFTQEQKDILMYAYYYGRDHGFSYLMAAIAWRESCAGEYLINFSDPSAGIYHAHIPNVIRKYTKYADSSFLRNVVGQMLISDPLLASSIALDNLRYWHKVHKGDLQKIIKSYNKGFAWRNKESANKQAQAYYIDIMKKIKELETFIPQYIHIYKLQTPYRDFKIKFDEKK